MPRRQEDRARFLARRRLARDGSRSRLPTCPLPLAPGDQVLLSVEVREPTGPAEPRGARRRLRLAAHGVVRAGLDPDPAGPRSAPPSPLSPVAAARARVRRRRRPGSCRPAEAALVRAIGAGDESRSTRRPGSASRGAGSPTCSRSPGCTSRSWRSGAWRALQALLLRVPAPGRPLRRPARRRRGLPPGDRPLRGRHRRDRCPSSARPSPPGWSSARSCSGAGPTPPRPWPSRRSACSPSIPAPSSTSPSSSPSPRWPGSSRSPGRFRAALPLRAGPRPAGAAGRSRRRCRGPAPAPRPPWPPRPCWRSTSAASPGRPSSPTRWRSPSPPPSPSLAALAFLASAAAPPARARAPLDLLAARHRLPPA